MGFKIITLISMCSLLTMYSSCNGQGLSPNNSKVIKVLGKTVLEIDKTIWAIYQDQQSNFWFGSKENGVYHYNGDSLKQLTTKDGLISNHILGIQEDAAGNLFFETMDGISKFDGLLFQTLKMKNGDDIANEWKLEPNDLWFRVGFNQNGPYRYDGQYLHDLDFPKSPQEEKFHQQLSNASYNPYGVYSIYKDRKGFMWFGTSALGLCRFDGNTINWHYEKQLQTTPNGGDFGTRAIFEDDNGFFWINNSRYRYKFRPDNSNQLRYVKEEGIGYLNENNQMEFPFFLSITEDDNGDLWMVTYDNGVWKNDGEKLIHYPVKDGEKDVLLFSIYKDRQGILWLGTHNAGVFKYNGKSFEKFEPMKKNH